MSINTKIIELLKNSKSILLLVLFFSILFTIFGYDSKDWNGLEEEQDKTLSQKIFNRCYLSMISVSTIGFGDITPRTPVLKCIMMIYSLLILLHIYDLFT